MNTQELAARQAIVDTLYRYCRSMDRMDEDVYDTIFVPGAQLSYGAHFAGTAEEFRSWVWDAHHGMQAHSHQISNILVDLDEPAGTATSEAYVTVILRTKPDADGNVVDIVERGRYLDRWQRSDGGAWRSAERTYVCDVNQVTDASLSPPPDVPRDRTDHSYRYVR